ncbi:TolC family protein [Bacteroides sp. 224]|uniref:TolC family protein n=1 Tax=Bacteroides sp. 224 TaxID=2302936 RepID=UPI0013D14BB6|nr:TolC family protein [Bacteroides sp. 224]NDV64205.1 TolC family protein [Bacteroides sp. 224]
MKVFSILFMSIIGFVPISLYAQNERELDLLQCIEIASDSSLQAFIADNYYKAGYWEYRSYKAARLPALSLKLTPMQYNRNIIKRYDYQENIDVYRTQESLYSSAGFTLSQNFDLTGGTFFINSELGYSKNFGENSYTQFNSIPVRVGYSQALFGFNSFKWECKIEPLKFEKAKKQFLYRQQEIAENTLQYFFNYVQAEKEYKLALENLLSTDSLYNIALERQKISAISEADVLTLKLDKINAQNSLKTVELNMEDARFAFLSFLNLDSNQAYSLKLPENMDQDILISIDNALLCTRGNNPNYLAYHLEILEAEREVDRKRKAIFEADLSASIGFNQVANRFVDAYRRPLQQDIVTVSLTIPILDWGVKRGQINMAKSNLEVAKFSVQQKTQNMEEELISAIHKFNNQKEQIISTQEVLSLANEAYRINKKRFVVGKADISTLTLSLNRYKEAQRNYINSLKYYWTYYYKIKKITLYDFQKQENISVLFDHILSKL